MSRARLDLESYRASGVDVRNVDAALKGLVEELRPTLGFRPSTRTDIGHFAAIVDLGPIWIAVSTDGVGSKSLIAQWMERYDTIGVDCVACNVNDVLCVGAEPISMVDYLGVHSVDEAAIGDIGKGSYTEFIGCQGQIKQVLRILYQTRHLDRKTAPAGIHLPGGEQAVVAHNRLNDGATGNAIGFELCRIDHYF